MQQSSEKEVNNPVRTFLTISLQTVDHTFVWADPVKNQDWINAQPRIQTDGVHWNGMKYQR